MVEQCGLLLLTKDSASLDGRRHTSASTTTNIQQERRRIRTSCIIIFPNAIFLSLSLDLVCSLDSWLEFVYCLYRLFLLCLILLGLFRFSLLFN